MPPADAQGPGSLEAALAELRSAYAAQLRSRIGVLTDLWDQLRGGDPSALQPLHHIAHELAGSAGTFGFHDVGDLASELERLTGVDPDDPAREAVSELIKELGERSAAL